jgi:hypothetical protein
MTDKKKKIVHFLSCDPYTFGAGPLCDKYGFGIFFTRDDKKITCKMCRKLRGAK